MHVEIDRETDADRRWRELERRPAPGAARRPRGRRGLGRRCATPRSRIADELAAAPAAACPTTEVAEACELLRWLADDHFTFLGYREYELARAATARTSLVAVPGTGLGILRADQRRRRRRFGTLPAGGAGEGARAAAAGPHQGQLAGRPCTARPTSTTSASRRSTTTARSIGERRFLGLFTSAAYTRERRCGIPVLRRKVARGARARPGFAARQPLRQGPAADPRDLPARRAVPDRRRRAAPTIALAVLHLQERRQIRLFLRRDDYGRFMSCLVYLPRDRYTTAVRLRDGATSCARRSHGDERRLHRPGRRVGAGPAALRRPGARRASRCRDVDRDDARGAARRGDPHLGRRLRRRARRPVRRGAARARLLRSATATPSPRRYKEDFPARTAVADLAPARGAREPAASWR